MSFHRTVLWLGALVGALAMIGCSGESEPAAAARILSFQSSPAEIESGRTTTLAWETEHANRVEIVEVGGALLPLGDAPASRGAVQVSPTETTTYELRAYGKGNKVASQTAIVNVIPKDEAPAVVSFTATPDALGFGGEVTLAWVTANADSMRIVDASGTPVVAHTGRDATQGQHKLKPRGSTTYHLTVKGPGGEAAADVAISVHGQPAVTLTLSDPVVEPGGIATLHWSAMNTERVTILDEAGTVYEGTNTEGQVEIRPQLSTSFTAIARGPAGEGTARTTIHVRPVIDLFEVQTAGPVYPGEEVELRWKVRGARELTVARHGLEAWSVPEADLAEGSVRLPVGTDGGFQLRARSGSLVTESFAPVALLPVPRITRFEVTPDVVTADEDHAAEVTLSWFIDGASHLEIEDEQGRRVPVGSFSPRKDSITVSVHESTSFRLRAFNGHGVSLADVPVVAHPRARIDSFQALPSVAAAGESIRLFWDVAHGSHVAIEKVGEGRIADGQPAGGSFSDVVTAESSYVLKAYNALDFETVSEPIVVPLGDPTIESFTSDRYFVRPGLPVTLNWRNVGGQALSITDESGAVVVDVDGNPCSTTDLFAIVEGSCLVPGPAVGIHTWTLRVQNGLSPATEVTASVEVDSVSGPVVTAFEVEGPTTVGLPVTFTWETTEDILGNGALIEISLGGEVFYSSTTPSLSGSISHSFTTPGTFPVVIRAHSSEGDHRATRSLEIRGEAAIESFAANPTELDSAEGASATTFSWVWQNVWAGRIHTVGPNGELVDPPVLTIDGAATQGAGSVSYEPGPGIHEFALVVDNLAGSTAEARGVHIAADLVRATIAANKTDTVPGDDMVTVTWETAHASHVHVTPTALTAANLHAVQEIGNRFVDISTFPGVREHDVNTDDSGYAEIPFPPGITFPFDGASRNKARAWVDGVLSFDTSATSSSANVQLPASSTSGKPAHMALFWDDLHMQRPDHPRAKILSAVGEDAKGSFFAVQWSGIHPYSSTSHPASYNFQVILRPDGSFEYRYGNMATANNLAQGTASTTGFQNYNGSAGFTLSHNAALAGGFAHRSWSFEPVAGAASGTMTVRLDRNTDFAVWARNDYSSASDSTKVNFWKKPVVTLTAEAEVDVSTEFALNWSANESTAAEVLTADGSVLCSATSADGAATTLSGSCLVRENTVGEYTYKVRSTGGIASNVVEKTVTVKVYEPLNLQATWSGDFIDPGQTVTLGWRAVGAATYKLEADGVEIPVAQTPDGTIELSPVRTTTYVFSVADAPGAGLPVRTRSATETVVVRSNTLDQVEVSSTQVGAGGEVTFTWTSTNADGVFVKDRVIIEEVGGPARFTDIRESTTAQRHARTYGSSADEAGFSFSLPADFSFTYDGQRVTDVTASSNGWLSFSQVTSGWVFGNARMPSSSNSKIHLAPFWDDLDTDYVWVDRGTDPQQGPYVVIQWDSKINGSSAGRLEYQVLLYENGWFEYRYGNMAASQTGRADGGSATIGFQNRDGSDGTTVSFDTVMPGGLAGKSYVFKSRLPANGSATVTVSETTDFVICSFDGFYQDCQTITVVALSPHSIRLTELMITPPSGEAGQWIEVRNVSLAPIEMQGMTLEGVGDASHTISTSIRLLPGEFAVLSRGAEGAGGGTGADYVYGTDLGLTAAAGTVRLKLGSVVIDSITWDASWNMPQSKSISLDGTFHVPAGDNTLRNRWCDSTEELAGGVMGSPGFTGGGCTLPLYSPNWFSDRPFIDIVATGTSVDKMNGNDNYHAAAEAQQIGFSFPFFDGNVTQWWGSSNGFISFTALTSSTWTNSTTVPNTSTPNDLVAVFWDDLNSQTGSSVMTQLVQRDEQLVRIIQWTHFAVLSNTGAITFQIQLWQNGDIVMAYKDIEAATDAALARYLGSSVTIGIEDSTGTAGIPFLINQPWIFDGRVLAFERN